MPRQVAFLAFVGLIAWLLFRDVRRRPSVSSATWLVVVWSVIFASRPVSEWFMTGPAMTSADSYLEGSPTDRLTSLVLIAVAYVIMWLRRDALPAVLRKNGALFAFYAFWAISVLWSDYPFVAFKRWFKDFGAVVMVMIVLTERDPIQAAKAVFIRVAYLLVPISFLFVRFFPEIGRAYSGYNFNELMYTGVATHKNTLGALLLVSVVFLVWDLWTKDKTDRRTRFGWMDSVLVLLMAIWLLRVANSATALACTIVGVGIYLATGLEFVQKRLRYIEVITIVGGLAWFAADSLFNITELIVLSLGRDMTLTTRTDAWEMLLDIDLNPLIGAGFKSFWAGERMIQIWVKFPGIVQAHNGYVETYLEGGILGILFLFALLWSSFRSIKRHLVVGEEYARVRLVFWVIAIAYNFSEAAFSQLSLLWIVILLMVAEGPAGVTVPATTPATAPAPARPRPITPTWRPRTPVVRAQRF